MTTAFACATCSTMGARLSPWSEGEAEPISISTGS